MLPISAVLLAACTSSDTSPEDTGPFDTGPVDTGEDCEESSWFADVDGDGFGDPAAETVACEQPSGTVEDATDCDDAQAAVHPGAEETCGDGLINDCEGSLAEAMEACPVSWDLDQADRIAAGEGFVGWALAMDGDVDGDGVDELLVGAPDRYSETVSGQASLISGGEVVASISTETWAAFLGSALDLVDTDGDGLAEVLVSAPAEYEGTGAAYLFHAPEGELSEADADSALFGDGEGHFGNALAHGDLNGDGLDDLLIGERRWSNGESAVGRAYLVLGPLEDKQSMDEGGYDAAFDGSGGSYRDFGEAVATGDVDGDGLDDLLIGERYGLDSSKEVSRGRVYVFLGEGLESGAAEDADAVIFGESTYEALGSALATADVNGDGVDDLLAGAPYAQHLSNEGYAGAVRVFHGGDDDQADAVLGGELSSQAGRALASAGDANADGLEDLLVGAPYDTSGESAGTGTAYLVLGGVEGTSSLEEASERSVSSENEALGAAVGSGDIDGDGAPDAGIGAPFRGDSGEVILLPGGAF